MPRRFLPILLALVFAVAATVPAQGAIAGPDVLARATFDGREVRVEVTKQWPGGFRGEVVLHNAADRAVDSFRVRLALADDNVVRSSWSGELTGPDADGLLTLTSPDHLRSLEPGASHVSGFVATGEPTRASIEQLAVDTGGGDPDPDPDPDDAVFRETFERVSPGTYKGDEDLEVVACPGGGQCLQVRYRPDDRGSPRIAYRETLPAAREYTLAYDLRFDEDFEWVKGGKLPGLAPETSVTGCSGTVDDGWSVRLMWREQGRFVQYLYHQDKDERCGEDVVANDVTLEAGRWYRVAINVRVNSSASARDGHVRLFLDGEEVARREDLRLRAVDRGGLIERLYFSTFYGGADPSWAPSRTTFAHFDDLVVHPGLRTR